MNVPRSLLLVIARHADSSKLLSFIALNLQYTNLKLAYHEIDQLQQLENDLYNLLLQINNRLIEESDQKKDQEK